MVGEEVMMIIFCAIILVPCLILLAGICIVASLDIYTDIQDKIAQMRRKNYCRRCGKVIPKGGQYCGKCHSKMWYGE